MSEQIAEICRRSSMAEYLRSKGVDVIPCGKKMKCRCPIHKEKTPSFYVTPKPGGGEWFNCFGCGKYGDIIDLIMEMESRQKGDVIRSLSKSTGVELGKFDPSLRVKPMSDEILATFCREEAVALEVATYARALLEASGGTADVVSKLMIMYKRLDHLLAVGDHAGLRDLLYKLKTSAPSYRTGSRRPDG